MNCEFCAPLHVAFLVGARVFMSAAVLLSLLAVTLSLSRMWHRAKLLFSVGTCYTAQGKEKKCLDICITVHSECGRLVFAIFL